VPSTQFREIPGAVGQWRYVVGSNARGGPLKWESGSKDSLELEAETGRADRCRDTGADKTGEGGEGKAESAKFWLVLECDMISGPRRGPGVTGTDWRIVGEIERLQEA